MTLFSDKPGDDGLAGSERRLAMVATMTVTTMAVFDGSMVNIALPNIAQTLGVSASHAVWIANGYLLTAAMTLAIFSSLAIRIGFRLQFIIGLLVFTLASLGCALSSSLEMLVFMRLLQGVGGAATLSIAPAILRSVFPNRLLGRILGLNALLIGSITAVAPIFGGTLLTTLGWQWLFAINIPLGFMAVLFTLRAVPGVDSIRREPFDVLGGVLSAVMLGSLIMMANTFSQLSHDALYAESLIIAATYGIAAIVAGWLFIRRQRVAPKPLLPLDIFLARRFSLAALTSLATFVSQGILFIALPFMFQTVYGYSVFDSALLFTPWPIGIMLAASNAGKLSDRYSAVVISVIGSCLFALGVILLALLPDQPSVWDICLRSLLCGIGFGCFQSPNNREMLSNVSREKSGYASGVLAIVRTFGQCLGAALVGVILSLYGHSGSDVLLESQAVQISLWVAAVAAVVAILFSLSRPQPEQV